MTFCAGDLVLVGFTLLDCDCGGCALGGGGGAKGADRGGGGGGGSLFVAGGGGGTEVADTSIPVKPKWRSRRVLRCDSYEL